MDIIIHASMPWDGPEEYDKNHIHGNMCECGEPISDGAKRCLPCARAFMEQVKHETVGLDKLSLDEQLARLYGRYPRFAIKKFCAGFKTSPTRQ